MDLGIDVSLWHWAALLGLIVALLTVDLLLHRGNHEPTAKRALVESAVWVACGLGFSVVDPASSVGGRPSASTSAAT